jgi:hypothetical protein
MKELNNKWIGAYYPREIIENQRSKAILCLLFDKIICHFPVSDMACGGGHGMSADFTKGPLYEEGVIEIIEQTLLNVTSAHIPSEYWDTVEDLNDSRDLEVTEMALEACDKYNAVPITDNPNYSIPIASKEVSSFLRYANLQAAALAIKSLDIVIPAIANINDEDILEAREKLNEQLIPFRYSMLSLAPLVRDRIQSNTSLEEVFQEATYIVSTKVAPTLYELQRRITMERGKFWRKIIIKGGEIIPKIILNWTTKDALSAAISSIKDATSLASEVLEQKELLNSFKNQGGLGFLLSVADYPKFKD